MIPRTQVETRHTRKLVIVQMGIQVTRRNRGTRDHRDPGFRQMTLHSVPGKCSWTFKANVVERFRIGNVQMPIHRISRHVEKRGARVCVG